MGCSECDDLLTQYEEATFASARAKSKLQIAQWMHDLPTVETLVLEARRLAARQRNAHAALRKHRDTSHRIGDDCNVACAGWS